MTTKVLADLEKEVVKCIRCGACQNVCPVFKEQLAESTVARGKVRLIGGLIKGHITPTAKLEELMSLCLSCKACIKGCPSGVQTDELVEAARAELVRQSGLSITKKFIFHYLLRNNWLFDKSLKLGSIFQGLALRPGPGGQGALPRIPVGIDQRRLVQPLAQKPLRRQLPERVMPPKDKIKSGQAKGKVTFYTGCMINYVYPEYGKAVVNFLTDQGYEVIIPKNQQCCGTPAAVNGDVETGVLLAKANVDELTSHEVDAVITACASCGLALKNKYEKLLKQDGSYHDKAQKLGAKVKDFSQFVLDIDDWQEGLRPLDLTVTYHDPCHLGRGQGLTAESRKILKSIPGLKYVEMAEADRCCGAAGSFSLRHYELAKKINDTKTANIINTKADYVVSNCGSCLMHLKDGLVRHQSKIDTIHLAQVLEMAMKEVK
ncbi:MAG: (Fe-S)-binding protein [Bacillota bacterium]|nr:(Fe-S)-binding protein [Bacillota bacterium]